MENMEIQKEVEPSSDEVLPVLFQYFGRYGLLPKINVPLTNKPYMLKVTILLLLYSNIITGCTAHFIHSLKSGENYLFMDILEDASVAFSGIGIAYNLLTFVIKSHEIKELINELADFQRFGKPEIFENVRNHLNFVCVALYRYSFFGVIAYFTTGYLHKKECEAESARRNIDRVCGFLAQVWMPFDIKSYPGYQIALVLQFCSSLALCTCGPLVLACIYSIVELLIVKILQLRMNLEKLFEINDPRERKLHLRKCIEYHIEILNSSEKINKCFGKILLMYISFSSIVISLIAFQLLLDHALKTVLHLSVWVFTALLMSYSGQRLINESTEIPFELYSIPWYEGDVEIQMDIKFIMLRSSKVMALDAEGFCQMSLLKFSQIMQNAYSFVALLGQTYKPDK